MLTPLGLYVHIPWCPTRCIYCDFNTYIEADDDLKERYQTALKQDIRAASQALERPELHTIFIGGGTPTRLKAEQLIDLVETVRETFRLMPNVEVTVEANPGKLSAEYLRQLRQGGINRLSLGVQSFRDEELHFLSRLHTVEMARQAVERARAAGFENISLDLIFNLPDQTLEAWQFNLRQAIALAPEHLSLYSLIIEPGTPLQRQVKQGEVPWPDDDIGADMFAAAIDMLGAAGYVQYEISNWARSEGETTWQTPRLASAHNLIYWRNQPYLGVGAGAFSTIRGERWMNLKQPQAYIHRIKQGEGLKAARSEKSYERIDRQMAMREHMLLGLRLVREGVSAATFKTRFDVPLDEHFSQAVVIGLERGLSEWIDTPDGPHLRLTRSGRFLANQVILPFIEERDQ